MPDWEFERSIESMRLQAQLATEYGMSLEAVLSGTGISQSTLHSPTAKVSARQELRLIENIVSALPEIPSLGLEAGKRYHFTTFGMLGFAMVSSKTLREALSIGLRYIQLTFAFTRFDVEDTSGHTRLFFVADEISAEVQRYVLERDSACLMTIQKGLCEKPPRIEELSFQFPSPHTLDEYQDVFGMVPLFTADMNQIVFESTVLDSQMPQYNTLACEVAQQHCHELLNGLNHHGGITAEVRDLIAAEIANTPSMEEIANHLHMAPRTLHRKLKAHGSGFVDLRDQVRQSLADEYLFDLGLSVEQVSDRLGYAESTTFINAYKRWHGVTPHARRRAKIFR